MWTPFKPVSMRQSRWRFNPSAFAGRFRAGMIKSVANLDGMAMKELIFQRSGHTDPVVSPAECCPEFIPDLASA